MNRSAQRFQRFNEKPQTAFIFNFPEELLNKDWETIMSMFPADYFLYGMFQWVLADTQQSLMDMLDAAMDSGDEEGSENESYKVRLEAASDLLYEVAPVYHKVFTEIVNDLIPRIGGDSVIIDEVFYDHDNLSMYLVINSSDDEDEVITPTELINLENEDEDDDETSDDADEPSDEDEEPVDDNE